MIFLKWLKGAGRPGEHLKIGGDTHGRHKMHRRQLLKLGAIATFAGLFGHPVLAEASRMVWPGREISLYNVHTSEKISLEYCAGGEYCSEALEEINHIFRDHRTGEIKPIDPTLLDYLHAISNRLKPGAEIHIVSGYRSPATNLMLRQTSDGVAKHSLHLDGAAADFRIPGCDLRALRRVAVQLRGGGVGYYAASNFIHVDTGRVRFW
jgi:uncharacterized protein YcbK (DUF882 family)